MKGKQIDTPIHIRWKRGRVETSSEAENQTPVSCATGGNTYYYYYYFIIIIIRGGVTVEELDIDIGTELQDKSTDQPKTSEAKVRNKKIIIIILE